MYVIEALLYSSAGASSPAVPANAGSSDGLGQVQNSKGGSVSRIVSQHMHTSLSTSAGGSALGSSQPSCRPWERGDLLRRLSTFEPANWFGKPKVFELVFPNVMIFSESAPTLMLSSFVIFEYLLHVKHSRSCLQIGISRLYPAI